MPAEVVIVLAIVVGAIWLLVKIGQGIASAIGEVQKNFAAAAARRKQDRHLHAQAGLRRYVHTRIPDELSDFEKKFERARLEFETAKGLANWVARPLAWKKEEFHAVARPKKSGRYSNSSCTIHRAHLFPDREEASFDHSRIPAHLRQAPENSVGIDPSLGVPYGQRPESIE